MNHSRRLDAYRNSLDRLNLWIEENLTTDGCWLHPSSSSGYFSALHYAQYIGRNDWSQAIIRHVECRFVDDQGRLTQLPSRNEMMCYVPGWLAWGAFEGESYRLSTSLLDELQSFQSRRCGGVFPSLKAREEQRGIIDFDSTTLAGIAFARTGRVGACEQVADFLLNLYEAQPVPEQEIYTVWSDPGGLLTEADQVPATTVLRWSKARQHYYKIGLFALALIHAYGVTGGEKYLRAGTSLYRETTERASDLWTNTLSHKMCWAATTLHAVTSEKKYLEDACRLSDHLVTLQQPDGCFSYPELWDAFPPPHWEMLPNGACQFGLWIARTLEALIAGTQEFEEQAEHP